MGGLCCAEGFSQLFADLEKHWQEPPLREGRAQGLEAADECFACASKLSEAFDVSSEVLGVGSFGAIRRALCRRTAKACAVKTLELRRLPERSPADLSEELRIHRSCKHPNIVHIFECFQGQGEFHIAMEACDGGDFRDFMQREGRLCEWTAGLAMLQVLEAVMYLHEVHFVAHRDLKLENLLLKFTRVPLEENAVKITDFGLASRFAPGESGLSLLCGTPEYLAPEVILAKYDEKCDTWSCGIILFELLTGALPWDAETPGETMWMARMRPLRLDGLPLSEDVKALLRSLCRKDPRFRASAREALQSTWLARISARASGLPARASGVTQEAGRGAEGEPRGSSAKTMPEPAVWSGCDRSSSSSTEEVNNLDQLGLS